MRSYLVGDVGLQQQTRGQQDNRPRMKGQRRGEAIGRSTGVTRLGDLEFSAKRRRRCRHEGFDPTSALLLGEPSGQFIDTCYPGDVITNPCATIS